MMEVWVSLNFLTARQVRKTTKRYGYMTLFKRGTMPTILVRLRWDEHFRRRHPVLGRISGTWLGRAVVSLMSSAPTFLVTPMDFLVSKGDSPWIEQLVAWRRSKSLEIGSES
jgi:hypothetical protein